MKGNSSFDKIFEVTITSFLVLMTIEVVINGKFEIAHLIEWGFVATFIGTLIIFIQQTKNH